jgi:hypothetical protein
MDNRRKREQARALPNTLPNVKMLAIAAIAGLCLAGHADWIKIDEKGPYNPELTEERGEKMQQDLNVLPPMGSESARPHTDIPKYETDDRASAELAKSREIDAEKALAAAEESVRSEEARKPWLMPAVGLACALVAFGVIWWLRSWSERNLPPMSGRTG